PAMRVTEFIAPVVYTFRKSLLSSNARDETYRQRKCLSVLACDAFGVNLKCSESRVRPVELELATSAARKPRLRRARAVADAAAAGGAVKQPHRRNARSYGSADGQARRAVGHHPSGTGAHSSSSDNGS